MHASARIKQLGKKFQTPRGKFITSAMFFAAFIAVFIFLYPWLGLPIIAVGIIPLLIGAWFYGVWAGILFTLALYVFDLLVIMLLGGGNIRIAVHPVALLGLATGATASLIVGRLGESNRRNQEEFHQRMLLLEERNDRSRFLTSLNEISLGVMETDNISSMLEVLAERIGNLFNADHCYITFWDEKQHKVTPMAAYSLLSEAFFTNARRLLPNDLTLTAVALDAGHTIAIEDLKQSHQFPQDIADGYPSHSVLGLPLITGDRKLGAIVLGYNASHHFAKEEIEYGELATRQISPAITKVLLLEEARQRLHELAGLHNISQTFSLRGDPHQTFGLLTKTLAGLMNVKICLISLYNPVTHRLRPQTPAYGLDDRQVASIHYSLGTQISILEDSNFGTFRANSEAEIPAEYLPLARSMGVDCILIAPLLDAEKHLVGAIFAANKPGGFADSDIRLLEVFASQVTAVVQNAHLLNAERTRSEQLAVLHTIAVAISQADNEDQLIENVTLIIGQKLYSDSFGILLLDETSHDLYLHSSYRIGPHEGLRRVPLGVGVTGVVAKSGKPRRVNDASVSPEYLSLSPGTRSELCVPLKVGEKLLGVVNVESTKAGAFTIEDEELLTVMAGQLAPAIQRLRTVWAERYQTQQLERSNSLIQALAQVNARATAASDPDGVLQTLGSELTQLGLRCAVALSDANNQFVILRYFSLPKRLVRALERIGNIKMQNYAIPITKLSPYSVLPQHSSLVKDPLSTITGWAPGFPRHTAAKFLKLIGVTETTLVCHLPLITEGKPMGILWLWGETLKESDLNTVSLFASQVATALQNASLLTEVGRLAITDDLTGIFNRRHFFKVAEVKFVRAQQSGSPLSALIVDLDHFKQFNDCYGHGVGDQVLREVARLMSTALRESDIIGRYGGEEFSILLPDTAVKAAIYVAERLLSFVSDVPIETEAGKLTVQLSVGVAGTSKETPTLHSLILRADQAMYLAKRAGRNCVAVK